MKTLYLCTSMLVATTVLAQAPSLPTPPPAVSTPAASAASPVGQSHPSTVELVESVKRALLKADLPPNDIKVATHGEALVLTGHVGSKADAARALAEATAAVGDVRVISELEVPEATKPQ